MLLKNIARVFVKYAGNAVGFGLAGDAVLDLWDLWNKDSPDQQQKLAEVQQLVEQSAAETRQTAQTLAKEMAADLPEVLQLTLVSYLTQVPSMVRRSLKRPADPTGKTVPPGLLMLKPQDLIEVLPAKPARFKPGDRSLPGVGLELEELLGVGGFGEVWKARDPYFTSVPPVALKFCLDKEAARTLHYEAAILNQVMQLGRHSGIVQLQRSYLGTDPPCLEYEYVAGGDLTGVIHDWHRAPGGCSVRTVNGIIAQLAEIVGFAHRLNPPIVHRDLKPANILVQRGSDGTLQLKIADFGIGGVAADQAIKEAVGKPEWYVTSMATGTCTPLYASPQQQAGRDADPRDDVFALGVIWYQALTGNLSGGRPGGAGWRKRLADQGMSSELVALLERCFDDNPDDRPQDAAKLAERLKTLLGPQHSPPKEIKTADPPISEQEAIERLPAGLQRVYLELKRRVGAFGSDVQTYATRANLIFKAAKNFALITLRSREGALRFLVRPEGFSIPENQSGQVHGLTVTRMPDRHGWTLNHEFKVSDSTDLDAVARLLRQSYAAVATPAATAAPIPATPPPPTQVPPVKPP